MAAHTYRRIAVVLGVALLSLGLVALADAPADARTDSSAEVRFVDSVNAERASRGLPRLRVVNDLRSAARSHSIVMADQNRLHHNPNLGSDSGTNWRRVAENVGVGGSVPTLHQALMNSSGHRANILDANVTEIGVGVEVRSGRIWVTQMFRQPRSEPTISFRDVSSGQTHATNIRRLAGSGVTMGCGSNTYCPGRSITRAEMATFLARAQALMPRDPGQFRDTARGDVHAANIEAIRRASITTGCGQSDVYCPDRRVTRAEMASFLARSLDLPTSRSSTRFNDVRDGSTHAAAIEAIARAGITEGCGTGRYCPDRPVTRAEMASFLVRAFKL